MGEVGEKRDTYYSVIVPVYKSEAVYRCLFSFWGNKEGRSSAGVEFKCRGYEILLSLRLIQEFEPKVECLFTTILGEENLQGL